PQARELDGRVDFIGRSMQARVDQGRLGPVPLSAERIAIDNLAEPRVAIDLAAETVAAADVYATVAGLPLEGWSRFVDPVAASGSLSLDLGLVLPVRNMSEWQLSGQLQLAETTLSLPMAG